MDSRIVKSEVATVMPPTVQKTLRTPRASNQLESELSETPISRKKTIITYSLMIKVIIKEKIFLKLLNVVRYQ